MEPAKDPIPVERVALDYAGADEATAKTWPTVFWVAFHCWWIPLVVFVLALIATVAFQIRQAQHVIVPLFYTGSIAALVGLKCLANYRDCVAWLDPRFRRIHSRRILWLGILLWINLFPPLFSILLMICFAVL